MIRDDSLRMAGLTAGVAVLAVIAAGLGGFARGDGTFAEVTSARGEVYDLTVGGVYAHNAQRSLPRARVGTQSGEPR